MMELSFLFKKKILARLKKKNNICINVFGYKNELFFPIYISDQKFEDLIDLLFLIDNDKSHYVYIKDFNRFMFHKTKNKKGAYSHEYMNSFERFNVKNCPLKIFL